MQEFERKLQSADGTNRIDLLHKLSYHIRHTNPEKAASAAKEALSLSIEFVLPRRQIISQFHLADALLIQGKFKARKKVIEEIRQLLLHEADHELHVWFQLCEIHQVYISGAIQDALEKLLDLDARLDGIELNSFLGTRASIGTKKYLGLCWLDVNHPAAAIESFYRCQTMIDQKQAEFEDYDLFEPMGRLLGQAYIALGKYKKARDSIFEEIENNPSIELTTNFVLNHFLIIDSYINEKHWTTASDWLSKLQSTFGKHQHTNPAHWNHWHHFSAIVQRHLGEYDEALSHINASFSLIARTGIEMMEEQLLLEQGLVYADMGKLNLSLDALNRALCLAEKNGNKVVLGNVHKGLGDTYRLLQDNDSALNHIQYAYQLDREKWAHSNSIAIIAAERQYQYALELKNAERQRRQEKAIQQILEKAWTQTLISISLALEIVAEAKSLINHSDVEEQEKHRYWLYIQVVEAQIAYQSENYLKSVDLIKRVLGQLNGAHSKLWQGRAYGVMGVACRQLGDRVTATESLLKRLEIGNEINNLDLQRYSYNGLGNIFADQGDYKTAVAYYESCIPLIRQGGNIFLHTFCFSNLAESLIQLGRFQDAFTYLEEVIGLTSADEYAFPRAIPLHVMGQLRTAEKKYDEALPYFEEAYRLNSAHGNDYTQIRVLQGLGQLHIAVNQPAKAIEVFEEAYALCQKIDNRALALPIIESMAITYYEIHKFQRSAELFQKLFMEHRIIFSEQGELSCPKSTI